MPNVVDFPNAGGDDMRVVSALVYVARKGRALLELRLAEIGLKPGEDEILTALGDGGAISMAHLASTMSVRSSTVARCIDDLERRGCVVRIDEQLVRISDSGRSLTSQIADARKRVVDDLRNALGSERLDQIAGALEDLGVGLDGCLKVIV